MKTTTLIGTDITTTRLGFGCAQLMRIGSASTRRRLLATAFDAGIRHFDVARMYGIGAAERELGSFARGRRNDLVIATKFGIDIRPTAKHIAFFQSGARRVLAAFPVLRKLARRSGGALVQPHDYSPAKARSSLETSLRELRTDYIDIFFLHEPNIQDTITDDLIAYLEQARSIGLIRAFGLSGNYADIRGISQRLPALANVVQFPNDALARIPCRSGWTAQRAALTYSPFSNSLPAVHNHLNQNNIIMQKWSERLNIDCRDDENIADLLLLYCMHANSEGTVIFSSTKSQRISRITRLANNRPQQHFPYSELDELADEILSCSQNTIGTAS